MNFLGKALRSKRLIGRRFYASDATSLWSPGPIADSELPRLNKLRNIGISAHIDSGKTTLTERILFYTGRINAIHEVRGKDGVGAKMDHMELEREKGITIQSAATYTRWSDHFINIIDTPGHVDFTIEVERSLRVLDSAILVVCAASGVQSQTMTVDKQMKRYNIPRLIFLNKCDRIGANPINCVNKIREKLRLNAFLTQLPIGLESEHKGVVDLIENAAFYFDGPSGETIRKEAVPLEMQAQVKEKFDELIQGLADIDEEIGDLYIMEETPTKEQIKNAIRRQTIALKFVPVFCGSAFKNVGVQLLLDAVVEYMPAPHEVKNYALDLKREESSVEISSSAKEPLLLFAFKLEDGKFGQLTYCRIYQGRLTKGSSIFNSRTRTKERTPRIVRMHSNEMEDVDSLDAGEIGALFGLDCVTGDTFTDGKLDFAMSSIFVPDPVMSLSIKPKATKDQSSFRKAISRFCKEDPTFTVGYDEETKENLINGMGELHLDVYIERMKREYNCNVIVGTPKVAFRETLAKRVDFDYTHKKQTGGKGQFARVKGYIEGTNDYSNNEFQTQIVGGVIPNGFFSSCEAGFNKGLKKGFCINHPVKGVRMVINDGAYHEVDSSDFAFQLATFNAFKQSYDKADPKILEPVMSAVISAPVEFQKDAQACLNKRKAMIMDVEVRDEVVNITAEVGLKNMFGFSSDLRSATQGKGEFSMEYLEHRIVSSSDQRKIEEELGSSESDDQVESRQ